MGYNSKTIDEEAIQQADYLINLAGAGIADKSWTEERKKLIISSRVHSTLTFKKYIEASPNQFKAYIAASAMGFYGNRGDEILTETSEPGETGFLAQSVIEWESAIQEVMKTNIRTVALRIGLVLSTKGGALPKILIPARLGVGSYFGDGQQWYAWIHLDDICRMFVYAVENQATKGFYNATAPNPLRNKTFVVAIGEALGKPQLLVPAPVFALRLGLGELADAVLSSARVLPKRMEEAGFEFQFKTLVPALQDLFHRSV
ncbi:MAG: TIGR01777 family protein [Saprospiraceae bacterium]|nr:TIGR01777 family protein [Saprospiraceae bacterium]